MFRCWIVSDLVSINDFSSLFHEEVNLALTNLLAWVPRAVSWSDFCGNGWCMQLMESMQRNNHALCPSQDSDLLMRRCLDRFLDNESELVWQCPIV